VLKCFLIHLRFHCFLVTKQSGQCVGHDCTTDLTKYMKKKKNYVFFLFAEKSATGTVPIIDSNE